MSLDCFGRLRFPRNDSAFEKKTKNFQLLCLKSKKVGIYIISGRGEKYSDRQMPEEKKLKKEVKIIKPERERTT
jgi:hypothetical protein